METKERAINLLPFRLKNGEKINAWYNVLAFFYDELIEVFTEIIEGQDIDNAQKFALDIIGDIVVKKRTEKYKDDEKYRNRLKTKIMQNNSRGYIEDINNIASAFLGENFIGIRQGYRFEDLKKEPAMLEIMLSGNKLENTILDNTRKFLKCGTNTSSANLGGDLQAITTTKMIRKYKPISVPNLQSAIALGVRLQYRVKNLKEIMKITSKSVLNFKTSKQEININKAKSKINIKNTQEVLLIKSKPFIFKQNFLKCGVNVATAKMGVLL